jgi:hypothetical protein
MMRQATNDITEYSLAHTQPSHSGRQQLHYTAYARNKFIVTLMTLFTPIFIARNKAVSPIRFREFTSRISSVR